MLDKLRVPEWCCAVRFNTDGHTVFDDLETPFTVLKNSRRYWCADPFLYQRDGQYYLFFEAYDRLKRKGMLGYRTVSKDGCGKIQVFYESAGHLSYPFLFEKEGELYIMPESSAEKELFLLRCVSFPDQWVKERVLLQESLADTTRLVFSGSTFYLSEQVDDTRIFDRLDLFYEDGVGRLCPCAANPVKRDLTTARCAGACFQQDDQWLRPSQDCGETYGGKLNFNRIDDLTADGYAETCIKTISVSDIRTNSSEVFSGIHTYNTCGPVEVVDLKLLSCFHLLNLIGAVWKRIRRKSG